MGLFIKVSRVAILVFSCVLIRKLTLLRDINLLAIIGILSGSYLYFRSRQEFWQKCCQYRDGKMTSPFDSDFFSRLVGGFVLQAASFLVLLVGLGSLGSTTDSWLITLAVWLGLSYSGYFFSSLSQENLIS